MTEAEWLESTDPRRMLEWAQSPSVDPTNKTAQCAAYAALSDRKLRLFACACARQVWDGVTCPTCSGKFPEYCSSVCYGTGRVGALAPHSRTAVEMAEHYADGEATENQMRYWRQEFDHANSSMPYEYSWLLVHNALLGDFRYFGEYLVNTVKLVPFAAQADLLRCIVGNPFRPVTLQVTWEPTPGTWNAAFVKRKRYESCPWLTYNDSAVPKLARSIYDARAWSELPILADALEEAGCGDERLLQHLRGYELCPGCSLPGGEQSGWCEVCDRHTDDLSWVPLRGPHARGCHVLDLMLGRG